MAHVKLNPVLESVRGKVGDLVFRKRNGTMFIARKPDAGNRVFTEAQKAVQERFRQAAIYGKMVMADAQARATYEQAARKKGHPIFSLMVGDFFNAPSVDEIDMTAYNGEVGNTIAIRASDDFDVVGVTVAIANASGDPIESGAAVKSTVDSGRWVYTTSTSVPEGTPIRVEVTATDRPGHKTTRTENA